MNKRYIATPAPSRLLVREDPPPNPALRLFCFPYAGGSAAIYRGWQRVLGNQVEVLAVELPGHGIRFREAPVGDLVQLVDMFMEHVPPLMDRPVVFFGHSNGALMAYALARRLHASGMGLPDHLILSAKPPPHLDKRRGLHRLSQAALVEELKTLGGTPPEVLENPEMMELLLPMLRADFALSETYAHPPAMPLPCTATLISGTHDPEAAPHELSEWAHYVEVMGAPELIDGGHFFIHTRQDATLARVRAALVRMPKTPHQ